MIDASGAHGAEHFFYKDTIMKKRLASAALALSALLAASCASTAAFPKALPDSGFAVASVEILDEDGALAAAAGGAAELIAALPFAELGAALEEASGLHLEAAHVTAQSAEAGRSESDGSAAARFETDAAQTAGISTRCRADGVLRADIALSAPGKNGRTARRNYSVRVSGWTPRRTIAAAERSARVSFGPGVCVQSIDGEPFAVYERDNAAEGGGVLVESGREVSFRIIPVVPADGITAGTALPAQTVRAEFKQGGTYSVRLEADRSAFFKTDWTARIAVEELEPAGGF